MTQSAINHSKTPRQEWMAVLARTPANELLTLIDALAEKPIYSLPRPIETGLSMVRGRVSANGEPFNLGEMSITRCVIQLEDSTQGVAYIAGRDKAQAELAAVIDALLQNKQIDVKAIEPLQQKINNARQKRAEQVASTKVDFFTLVRGED